LNLSKNPAVFSAGFLRFLAIISVAKKIFLCYTARNSENLFRYAEPPDR
jgi:hypothetical protein